jgi:ribosomal protein S27AE
MLRIPNPTPRPCPQCGHPTVAAEFPTGIHRVHCGTYRHTRGTSRTAMHVRRCSRPVTITPGPADSEAA